MASVATQLNIFFFRFINLLQTLKGVFLWLELSRQSYVNNWKSAVSSFLSIVPFD